MQILLRKVFLILTIFVLSSCGSSLQKLSGHENRMKQEGFYSSYLSLEYLEFSRSLLANKNYLDSEYFATKGLDAARGYNLIPENPRYWGVDELYLEDMITAQKRYEDVSTDEVRTLLPIQMAHLSFLYDCWVVNETKPLHRLGELAKCKERFYKLLEEVEYFVENYGRQDSGPKTEIAEPIFERYLVLFDFDKYKINAKANKQIIKILNVIDAWDGDYSVVLVGNADRSGKNLYNEGLALRRARVVRQYLFAAGVPRELVELRVQGEEFPDLITKDKVRQQFNRTTQVYIVKGRKTVKDIPLPVLQNKTYKQEIEKAKKKRGLN